MHSAQNHHTNSCATLLPKAEKTNSFSQNEFLAAICHELRTPILAIIGMSEILKKDINDPSAKLECEDFINEINAAANDLNELVYDLIELGSVGGDFSVDLSKKIDVKNIIERSIKINYDYSLRRKINIRTEIQENLKPINLDAKRLKQIITNLVSNSIKYSPENTTVVIKAEEIKNSYNQTGLKISVIDQGFGMNKNELASAFKKYQTFKNPNSGKVDSFGMGLSIVKDLVELQNGKLSIESQPNQGTKIDMVFSEKVIRLAL